MGCRSPLQPLQSPSETLGRVLQRLPRDSGEVPPPVPSCYTGRVKNIKRIVFFGTHELAVPALETLEELDLRPELVVTRPQAGLAPGPLIREEPQPPPHPVKLWVKERGIPLVSSRRAAEADLHERIGELKPDLLVVVDYGRALPEELLEKAARGAMEVHPSLLPKHRGSNALRSALSQGDRKVGVTVFQLDEVPWGGLIILSEEIPLEGEETFGELLPQVQEMVCSFLADGLQKFDKSKKPKGRKQNPKSASKAARITTRHRRAPWQLSAKEVFDRWRAHAPPGITTSIRFRTLTIVKGSVLPSTNVPFGETGTYLGLRSGRIAILCGEHSAFGIEEVLVEGEESSMSAGEAADLLDLSVGDQFI